MRWESSWVGGTLSAKDESVSALEEGQDGVLIEDDYQLVERCAAFKPDDDV